MKKLILISILSALSLAATAQSASDTDTVTISGAEQKITLPSNYSKMWPEDFYAYKGSYDLSNGKSLFVFSRGSKMYAQVEDQPGHEIVAATSNTFVALDKQLKMTIDLHDNGDVSGELLMVVKPGGLASGVMTGAQYMAVAFR